MSVFRPFSPTLAIAARCAESATDHEVIEALGLAMRTEGIIPAMESARAFVQAFKEAPRMRPDQAIIINMSGRGDKDIFTIARL